MEGESVCNGAWIMGQEELLGHFCDHLPHLLWAHGMGGGWGRAVRNVGSAVKGGGISAERDGRKGERQPGRGSVDEWPGEEVASSLEKDLQGPWGRMV